MNIKQWMKLVDLIYLLWKMIFFQSNRCTNSQMRRQYFGIGDSAKYINKTKQMMVY